MSGSGHHVIPVRKDTSVQSAPVFVIRLKRFCVERDKVIKDDQFFKCLPQELHQI